MDACGAQMERTHNHKSSDGDTYIYMCTVCFHTITDIVKQNRNESPVANRNSNHCHTIVTPNNREMTNINTLKNRPGECYQNSSQDPWGAFLFIPFQVDDLNNGKVRQKCNAAPFVYPRGCLVCKLDANMNSIVRVRLVSLQYV